MSTSKAEDACVSRSIEVVSGVITNKPIQRRRFGFHSCQYRVKEQHGFSSQTPVTPIIPAVRGYSSPQTTIA
ncbi:MAG: hypothetical protein QGG74_02775 [Phycisphaerales bacterium]|nr:hypothetical protein [Phycisphaerales bacterium]